VAKVGNFQPILLGILTPFSTKQRQPPVRAVDHPVRQRLPRDRKPLTGKLLLLPVQRLTVHIFLRHHIRHAGGRGQTTRVHGPRHRRGHDRGADLLALVAAAG
jgi:hypothetical protein